MSVRYFVQIDGEEQPRGPLPAGAVRRLFEAGEIVGGSPMCQEGDADWLTLDDYWDDVMPPKPAPAPSYSAYASLSGGAVHPALIREPTPVWKIVFGVLCFLWAAGGILWGANLLLAGSVAYALPLIALGVVWFIVGLKLTSRK